MSYSNFRITLLSFLFLALTQYPHTAFAESSQRIIQMLDYIGVDYPNAVKGGQVADPTEYTEMQEFSAEVLKLMEQMPEVTEKSMLLSSASAIQQAINKKQDGEKVATKTAKLKQQLISSYAIAVAPAHVPDMQTIATLFESKCASCHGAVGDGNGPLAKTLSPSPSNFHDMERQHSRSVYDLFNTISLGVAGTPMPTFNKQLTEQQRWGLAFYVSQFSATDEQREQGKKLWSMGTLRDSFSSLSDLTSTSYADIEQLALAQNLNKSQGASLLAYLRQQPQEFEVSDHVAIDKSISMLSVALEKARMNDSKGAHAAALSAYLDGFELAEPSLVIADKGLKKRIEDKMIAFRELSKSGDAANLSALESTHNELVGLLEQAKSTLSSAHLSVSSAFFGSLIILLREGVEAILVLAAMMAALIKTGRKDAIKFIHVGWIGAVILGIFTWWVAENLIDISGASREMTEGIAALLAAAILVYVGFWLHNASHSQRWQKFVQHKVNNAMENKTLWILATVSFIAVYREMFETVLFYQAMWVQVEAGSEHAFLLGIVAAIVLLAIIAFLIFKLGVRLPIKQFFQINAVLLFILAVIFTGQGIAAMQEAGVIPAKILNFPSVELLGIYPTLQGIGLQLAVLLLGVILMVYQKKKMRV